jgi:hypothetical protein
MPRDEQRFPELLRDLYRIKADLEKMFPGRPFTPDGHMVGGLAECFAEYYYDLNLYACSHSGMMRISTAARSRSRQLRAFVYRSGVAQTDSWSSA